MEPLGAMMAKILGVIAVIGSVMGTVWLIVTRILLYTIRLNDAHGKNVIGQIRTLSGLKFYIKEEYSKGDIYPRELVLLCWLKGYPPIHFSSTERLLRAGWEAKDTLSYLTTFRWGRKKIFRIIEKLSQLNKTTDLVPVSMIQLYGEDAIGKVSKVPAAYIGDDSDMEISLSNLKNGLADKLGLLLYGPPGNGKSMYIRYLASKYSLPIKLLILSPDYTNKDIIRMAANIPDNSCVVLEDFDNSFNHRDCLVGKEGNAPKFTFDAVLNVLDGIYNNYKNVLFIMTVNDINKVDAALKNRPSRFKHVFSVSDPNQKTRESILMPYTELLPLSIGCNLDKVFLIKELFNSNYSVEQIKSLLSTYDAGSVPG